MSIIMDCLSKNSFRALLAYTTTEPEALTTIMTYIHIDTEFLACRE